MDKNYNTLDNYFKTQYGKKVAKVALNAKFSCPNKDGKKGFGGCSYCSKLGSGDMAGDINLSLKDQYYQIKALMDKKWKDIYYMPYLQSNSNTYGSIEYLRKVYDEVLAINDDKIIGISIATRPDCINEEIAMLLDEYNKKIHIQIELGLQTSKEETDKYINRLDTNQEFSSAVNLLRKYNIEIVVHIINGLPYETKDDMINTINFINRHDIQGIKIHSLLVLKNTKMEQDYIANNFKILTLEEYVDITVSQIRHLRGDIVIHRLAADGVNEDLIAPLWPKRKLVVMNEIDKLMWKNNFHQGDLCK